MKRSRRFGRGIKKLNKEIKHRKGETKYVHNRKKRVL